MRDVLKLYKLKKSKLEQLVANGEIKYKVFRNEHNQVPYKCYLLDDIDKLVKLKVTIKER